jgi:hypothetical protein
MSPPSQTRSNVRQRPTTSRPLTFIVRPRPGADVIDAEPVDPEEPGYADQFVAAFMDHIVHGVRPHTANTKFEPPPPNYVPARPGYSISGSGHTGTGTDDPFQKDFAENPRMPWRRTWQELGFFVLISQRPSGSFVGIFHVPRKAIALFLLALFLMFGALYNLPAIWEIVFGLFGLA